MAKITSLTELTEVADDDLLVVVDKSDTSMADSGTDKKVQKVNLLKGLVPENGWIPAGETWTYAGADDPTFTFKVSADVTGKYSAGMKIKLTQTTVKYFIITAVSAYSGGYTTITVYGGTDYDLANATITTPYYSTQKAPQGFPLNPAKWSLTLTDVSARSQAGPTQNTFYNLNSTQISIPIGVWNISMKVDPAATTGTAGYAQVQTCLSTSTTSISHAKLSTNLDGNAFYQNGYTTLNCEDIVTVASKTTFYVISKTTTASISGIYRKELYVIATCAYL